MDELASGLDLQSISSHSTTYDIEPSTTEAVDPMIDIRRALGDTTVERLPDPSRSSTPINRGGHANEAYGHNGSNNPASQSELSVAAPGDLANTPSSRYVLFDCFVLYSRGTVHWPSMGDLLSDFASCDVASREGSSAAIYLDAFR